MIQNTFKDEIFDGDNKYYCDGCKNYSSKAIKKMKIAKLPNYVIVTINRFDFNIKLSRKIKLMYKVDILFDILFQ